MIKLYFKIVLILIMILVDVGVMIGAFIMPMPETQLQTVLYFLAFLLGLPALIIINDLTLQILD